YRPLVRRSKPVLKQVKTWPAGVTSALQDCFECTDWNTFREVATNGHSINLEEYTTSVTNCIGKCIDDVTVSRTITTRSNQKPWMTVEVHALLKSRDSAFRAGDKEAQRIHGHFQDGGDSRRMWQDIQEITNYKTTPSACDSDASLPDALNDFYTRFEAQNNTAARKTVLPNPNPKPSAPRMRPAQVSFTPAPGYHATWMQQQRKTRAKPRARTSPPPLPPVFEISTQNRFAPLREMACDAVIIGDSIVRHVRASTAKGKVHTRCLPGARVLDVSAQVPAILKKNIGAVVLHAGMNDIRLRQTEILKKDFRSLVEKVRTTSPTMRIIVSGPLPTFQRGIE
ncbi:hypothetical protein QTP86_033394, partial [Hemibagrus guttatus]